MSKQTITIYENGVWAGNGDLLFSPNNGGQYFVSNCAAELGSNSAESDAAYEAIDAAINAGEKAASVDGYEWTWEIEDA